MMAMLASLRSLGTLKLGAMAAVTLVSFGLLGFLMLRSNEGPMALLYGDLDLREAGQVVDGSVKNLGQPACAWRADRRG